jgi:hypothetical protein
LFGLGAQDEKNSIAGRLGPSLFKENAESWSRLFGMASWSELESAHPEFATRVRHYMDMRKHKVMATVREDGSPRVSGTEVQFENGELWFGSMPGAWKARDLQRDPRFSLHSGSEDPPSWKGDAKLAGVLTEVNDPEARRARLGPEDAKGAHLFRADIREASVVEMGEPPDHLVVQIWVQGKGLRTVRRD